MVCTYNSLLISAEYSIDASTVFHISITLGSIQPPHYHKKCSEENPYICPQRGVYLIFFGENLR